MKHDPSNKSGLKLLKNKLLTTLEDLDLPWNGPYELDALEKLCDYFGIIVRLFEFGGTKLKYMYPKDKKSGTVPEINLLITVNDKDNLSRVDYIENLRLYLKPFGIFCIICNRVLRKNSHKCGHPSACYACSRIAYPADVELFETRLNHKMFCKEVNDQWTICEICGTTAKSKACAKLHKTKKVFNCRNKRKCILCDRFYVFKKNNAHVCEHTEFCKICHEYHNDLPPKQHFCKLLPQKEPKYYPGLATWDLETTSGAEKSPLMCRNCTDKEIEYLKKVCKTHSQLSQTEKSNLLCELHKGQDPDGKMYHLGKETILLSLKKTKQKKLVSKV